MSQPISLSVKDLLQHAHYMIPMYQRNYSWEKGEISQLINDILDYLQHKNANYYHIGTLVVFKHEQHNKKEIYEVIDGQQRLTTLSLLMIWIQKELKNKDFYFSPNIEFECRESSQNTINSLFNLNKNSDDLTSENIYPINNAIVNGYKIINDSLIKILNERNVSLEKFTDYLINKVQILRVEVPAQTDLNHYFEVMNNRGEQLEKHEILKAKLLSILDRIKNEKDKKYSKLALDLVWNACANMNSYIQSGFDSTQRQHIFGENWDDLLPSDINSFIQSLENASTDNKNNEKINTNDNTSKKLNLNELIQLPFIKENKQNAPNSEGSERFHSVISFPNFLIHVLNIVTKDEKIALDDKRLLDFFDQFLLKPSEINSSDENIINNVRNFIWSLLKCKYLFDQWIIKREYIENKDSWSLKTYRKSNSKTHYYANTHGKEDHDDMTQHSLIMILSALHVSTPTQAYKYWLNGALNWLYNAHKVQGELYLTYLEKMTNRFVFDLWLVPNTLSYQKIIYSSESEIEKNIDKNREYFSNLCENLPNKEIEHLENRLSYGKIAHNLIFNYLDYLLWKKYYNSDDAIKKFEFTFRSSVEHYYPQTPMNGYEKWETNKLNSFGNLCLISHSKNSRLSNLMFEAKQSYYHNNDIDSIKQYLMMKEKIWNYDSLDSHYNEMKSTLISSLDI